MKSTIKVFQVLEALCENNAIGLSELSRKLNFNKASIHRFLSVLVDLGYVEKDEYTKKYDVTLKLFQLGVSARNKKFSLNLVRPYMEELAKKSHETVNLALFIDHKAVVIDRVESSETLKTDLGIGTSLRAYCTALGKVFLSHLSEDNLETYLRNQSLTAVTPNTITSETALKKDLSHVKILGYALDDMESDEGVRCIAVPITNSTGQAIAAISISGPSSRLSLESLESFKQTLLDITEKISQKLG